MITLYQKVYIEYSAKYKGDVAVLLLVGKFYELYDMIDKQTGEGFNTTKKAAEKMNITLKTETRGEETFMKAGVPEQTLHKFAQMLTQDGWTVVVVDQIRDTGGNVIDRVPVRILSAGTHFETATSERMSLACLYITADTIGASVIDITTGEAFSFESSSPDEILHMFQVYSVKETLVYQTDIQKDENTLRTMFSIRGLLHISSNPIPPTFYSPVWRETYFTKMFRLKSLMPVLKTLYLPEERNTVLEIALTCVLRFMEDHFPQQCDTLHSHIVHIPSRYVRVSNNMLEQLNMIVQKGRTSVLDLVDKTHCSIGKRALRERMLRPVTDPIELEARWTEIDWILGHPVETGEATISMRGIGDLPRLHHRISCGNIRVNDVLLLWKTYTYMECLFMDLVDGPLAMPSHEVASIRSYIQRFQYTFDEKKAFDSSEGGSNGYLTEKAGPKTHILEERIKGIQGLWLRQWATFCQRHGMDENAFSIRREESGELFFECPRYMKKQLEPALLQSGHFTQLKMEIKASGPITITCDQLSKMLSTCYSCYMERDKVFQEEMAVACDILWDEIVPIQSAWIEWIGRVDCTLALAAVSSSLHWVRPTVSTSSCLDIEGLRHPLLEQMNTRFEYVKHNVRLDEKEHGWLVYGVNASGKSSLMKATGIAVLLAQAGCFVPATHMKFRPYTATFSRIWSHDNLWAGLSSFAVEVGELRDIIQHAGERSLVLGDEVCSGTESISATALVASTLEHLDSKGTHFMFATHLHDLLHVKDFLPREGISVWHLSVIRTTEGKLIYDRRLQRGSGSATYGLEVARAMGLPFSLMERALEIRKGLDREGSIKSLYNQNVFREECAHCHTRIVSTLHTHHIEEQANGGSHHVRNLAVLCEDCHVKHHSGEINVERLRVTSDGLERVERLHVTSDGLERAVVEKSNKIQKAKYNEEELNVIKQSIYTLKGRPLARIRSDLKLKGIQITEREISTIQKQNA